MNLLRVRFSILFLKQKGRQIVCSQSSRLIAHIPVFIRLAIRQYTRPNYDRGCKVKVLLNSGRGGWISPMQFGTQFKCGRDKDKIRESTQSVKIPSNSLRLPLSRLFFGLKLTALFLSALVGEIRTSYGIRLVDVNHCGGCCCLVFF